jgi:hypothetical protein
MPHAAPHQHRLPVARVIVAALAVIATGCASDSSSRAREPQFNSCVRLIHPAVVAACAVGAVALVATHDAVVGVIEAERKGAQNEAENGPNRLEYIGELATSDFSPAGTLLVDTYRSIRAGRNTLGTLLVNLDKPPDGSRRSIEQDVEVACSTGKVTYKWRRTFGDWNGALPLLSSATSTIELAPGPLLDSAAQTICDTGS